MQCWRHSEADYAARARAIEQQVHGTQIIPQAGHRFDEQEPVLLDGVKPWHTHRHGDNADQVQAGVVKGDWVAFNSGLTIGSTD